MKDVLETEITEKSYVEIIISSLLQCAELDYTKSGMRFGNEYVDFILRVLAPEAYVARLEDLIKNDKEKNNE